MNKTQFINLVKELGSVESVSRVVYLIESVTNQYVIGLRTSTQKPFKIETDGLFAAYNDMINGKLPLTTTALKTYVNRTQSPALAILMALRK